MSELFSFPNPVNEKAARVVAGIVALTALVALLTGWRWLLVPLAYGFIARAATGPTLSPLGRFAMNVVAPRLGEPKRVAGPPKRFAQAIGAVCTTLGAIFAVGFGWTTAADVLLAMMVVFATLESVFAVCVGCKLFAVLMRLGVVPPEVCESCNDIWARVPAPEQA
ncbi:MAG: transporter permease [Solirubrobacterales bacterium]|nr:transporter permease [Solirubrobacterales bacterium]